MWKEWFNFSRAERYGIIILLTMLLVLAIAPYLFKLMAIHEKQMSNPQIYSTIDSFLLTLEQPSDWIEQPFSFSDEEKPKDKQIQPFTFDPNTVTTAQLVHLGLSAKQAQVVENYRAKGGKFKTPEDFKKLYVINDETYKRLKPYIDIATSAPDSYINATPTGNGDITDTPQLFIENQKPVTTQLVIELNSTDTLELVKLKGIGRNYARRIIAYRTLLGGYHNTGQLSEVYGLSQSTIGLILPHISVDSTKINPLNINLIDYNDLKRHPYVNEFQARSIIYYRETVGAFNSTDELLSNKLIDSVSFARLEPYVTVY